MNSPDIGRWTLEIEAETPKTDDVFLTLVMLGKHAQVYKKFK